MLVLTIALLTPLILATSSRAAHKPRHSHRFLIAQRVNRGLRGTPLARLGFVFEAAGWRHRLSPFFLAGASATESSLGTAACQANPKNIWGLGSCDRAWRVPYFETWPKAIGYFARFVRLHWPRARTAYELYGYCGCGARSWGSRTSGSMAQLFGDQSGSLGYPGTSE